MVKKSLKEWLEFLENTGGRSDVPANERCREMLRRLKIPKFCPIVTIGGTNGKGSSTHFLAAYAKAMRFHVGRYTSPHLLEFNERIAIDGQDVSDQVLVNAFERIRAAQQDLYLGYVDYAFLAAMLIFFEANVNFLVLEVGLGGRLDAVNSVDADCALITTIHFDHTHLLGNTREAIGFEKAGIFRAGQIAVCGDTCPPQSIRNHAKALNVKYFECPKDFNFINIDTKHWSCQTVFGHFQHLPIPHFPVQNALTVLMAILLLDQEKRLPFNEAVFRRILVTLHIPGRMQQIMAHPQIVVDVAHNPESVTYLADYLSKHPISGKTIAIFSALKDKNIDEMVKSCQSLFHSWNVLELDHPRRTEKTLLEKIICKQVGADKEIQGFSSINSLMESVLATIEQQDRIIVFGSFYIADLFLKWYNRNKKSLEFIWH